MYIRKYQWSRRCQEIIRGSVKCTCRRNLNDALLKLSKHGDEFPGMVETTIAMHYVFESLKAKIVYDVSSILSTQNVDWT